MILSRSQSVTREKLKPGKYVMLGLSFVLCVAIEITYANEVNGEDSINESLSTERGTCSESISWFVTTNGREILDQALRLVTRQV